jgi:hypothetical protein
LLRDALEYSLEHLWEEAKSRTHLVEGSALEEAVERSFYYARVTWLLGLLSVWGLWRIAREDSNAREIVDFVNRHKTHLRLLGEADVPKFLAVVWLLRKTGGTAEGDFYLRALIEAISRGNIISADPGIPDPYHSIDEILQHNPHTKQEWDEHFAGQSYSLETLVLLFAKRGWRQCLAALWPGVTRVAWCSYRPDSNWLHYWWDTGDRGCTHVQIPPRTGSWRELRQQAEQCNLESIPVHLRNMPELLALFTLVAPHRLTADVAKYLDSWVDRLTHVNQL